MTSSRRRIWMVLVAVLSGTVGCNLYYETDSIELTGDSGTIERDVGDTSGTAGDTDGGDGSNGDPWMPRSCEADVAPVEGECHPEKPSTCGADEVCMARSFPNETKCIRRESFGANELGDSCSPQSDSGSTGRVCAPGTDCIDWDTANTPDPRGEVCSRICALRAEDPCGDGEICTNPFGRARGEGQLLEGIGFCTRSCDPYADDCQRMGVDCVPDPNFFAGRTCGREFRCLSDQGVPEKSAGDSCSARDYADDGCGGPTLLCVPKTGEGGAGFCAKPCTTNDECMVTCIQPGTDGHASDWEIGYCAY